MKLAIIRQKYRHDGGAERFVSRALSALSDKSDLNISIITRQWETDINPTYNVITCDPPAKNRLQREINFAREAQRYFVSFDIVQSHERIPGCTIYRAGDGVHKEWLNIRSRTMNPLQKLAQAFSRFHRYQLRQEKAMFEHPSLEKVICNSFMVKEEIIKHFTIAPEKIHVIYNCIDTNIWNPSLSALHRRPMRERYSIPLQATLMLFVGSGFERKGLDVAIHAIANHPNVWLLVVGNDRKSSHYKKIAQALGCEQRLVFVGVQKETAPFYAMADALIQPTRYDPFPNTILEAMACGLPVLTSDKCGGKEFIDIGINGYVFDALDWCSFSGAIAQLQNDFDYNVASQISFNKVVNLTDHYISNELYNLYHFLIEKKQNDI
ncbi:MULTISPECIES: glycosyltransferase family 4 protein [Mangrovibacter]|uniref:UDP-glucose:(Heptosyl)LPS alpha-1,3-glucosyltransferase n=1 Tax=Mangrovibacter plantisponsor TaxID=451513 RepID=A0A317PUW5_9ENTR|nr:glycosyltransferase family 4 protein [Mangrovibacter plantisponsor]PWW05356.1 UDP-glucose:(heptosyl)LPS alpha-1,3-glucosyltransferase [Mangrovibacter plantisponsor]